MANSINGYDYGILNLYSPTRVPPNAELSSPDVSLASASLIISCSWQTLLTLSSDHLPILIRLQMKTPYNPGLRRTYVNLKNTNWDRYRQEVEAALSKRSIPTDCQRNEKIFRTILLKTTSHHTPTGRHRLHEEPVPAEILHVINRRDDLRKRAPNDTAYKWWSCHSGHKLLCKLCQTFPPQQWGPDLPFLGKPAMRTRWMAGAASHRCG